MIAYYKTEVPFLRLVLCFIIGISISTTQNLAPNPAYEITFYSLCGITLFFAIFYKRLRLYLRRDITGFIIYTTVLMAGIVITNHRKQIYYANHFSKISSKELIGVIEENPKLKGDIARFVLIIDANIDGEKLSKTTGKLLVALRIDSTKTLGLKYGDRIILVSKYKETEPPYNFAEFNYRRFLALQNIYHQTFINQKQIAVIETDQGNPIIAFALAFRDQQVAKIKNYLADKDARGVASTLVLGYRETLDRELLATYSNTGTMHVLSVSGMHVAIVAFLLNFLLGFMNRKKKLIIAKTLLIISLVWFYALITGLAPSVTRAAIMISFVLIAKAKSKNVNIFNVLGLSAFLILLYNPFSLVNVGFQLSYIAVGGLIYLYPKVSLWYSPENPIIKAAWSVMAVSISAQLVTAPFSLFYFHQFPVYFILSNLFIVIPATLIMYAGFAFLLFATLIPQLKVFAVILEQTIIFTNTGLKFIEEIPHANITQVWFDKTEIFLGYCLIIAILFSLKNLLFLRLSIILAACLIISLTWKEFNHIQQRNVTFFSLRKNTAIAFIKGRSAVLVTDLDTDEFTYVFSVKPYLDSCHINNIQFLNPHLTETEKVYNFEGKALKIIGKGGFNKMLSEENWLLLSSDRIFNLTEILSSNNFNTLLIDGRNRDFVIKNLRSQAEILKLPIKTLKREFAVEYKL
ncbi:ComEC/Rec2 family competence protein [Pedobacter arcticus]|uniref:ComEC/Rec2 family competence protein n=1 Tax=Pedobacter arcticus TaxID=752140 RepID=UPI000371DB66|nr:ComEC/Rec2 family competence protein [Pedobacter arcticus]